MLIFSFLLPSPSGAIQAGGENDRNILSSFRDIDKTTQYKEAVNYLHEKGIIEGYSDGNFRPVKAVIRAEFLKVLVKITTDEEIEPKKYQNCFSDVRDEWFAKYICYAKERGIVSGYEDSSFKPEKTVSFIEAAKMIIKSFEIPIEESKSTIISYKPPWYEPYVKALTENKRVPRTVLMFASTIKRNEMAEIVYRIKENIEIEDEGDWLSYSQIKAYSECANMADYIPVTIDRKGDKLVTYVDQETQFRGNAMSHCGTITKYEWDFDGDGIYDVSYTFDSVIDRIRNKSFPASYTYSKAGEYNVCLKVTNSNNFYGYGYLKVIV